MICGQKVICVNMKPHPIPIRGWMNYDQLPTVGSVYIVREVWVNWRRCNRRMICTGDIGITLVGIKNPPTSWGTERGFMADRFRLLEDAKLTESEHEQFAEALFTS